MFFFFYLIINIFSLVIIIFCLIRINNIILAIFIAYAINFFRNIIEQNMRCFRKVIAIKVDKLYIFSNVNT